MLAPFAFSWVAPQARADNNSLLPLVDAIAERLEIAEPVAAFKWHAHVAIEDLARVDQEMARLRDDADAESIDQDYVVRVFTDQIDATEAIEYRRFADWKLDASGVPTGPAELAALRATIDRLNTKILSQISLDWRLLHSPSCGRELETAGRAAIRSRGFDDLYRRALTTATQSYCQASPQA